MTRHCPRPRDLPPGRHAELRGAVPAATSTRQERRWVAPLVTAAAALAVVGAVAWFAPWGGGGGAPAATTPPSPDAPVDPVPPSVAGVSPEEVAGIEEGCAESGFQGVTLTLKQVLTDPAGRVALLHGDGVAVVCQLDTGPTGYNPGGGGLPEFTPPVSLDSSMASTGGDAPGNKPEHAGRPGTEEFAGRVSPEVVKVTVSVGDASVEASVANGTYLARLLHPADWVIPENGQSPVVRAYDKKGTLLAEIGQQPR